MKDYDRVVEFIARRVIIIIFIGWVVMNSIGETSVWNIKFFNYLFFLYYGE